MTRSAASRPHPAPWVAAALALGGCTGVIDVPAKEPDEVWVVAITDPRGGWSACFDDDAVAQSIMSGDLPTSGASAAFHRDAVEDDVRRVLGCLDGAHTGGRVRVSTTTPGP